MDLSNIEPGTPFKIKVHPCEQLCRYGRFVKREGGLFTMMTPGGTVVTAGFIYSSLLTDDEDAARLEHWEREGTTDGSPIYDGQFDHLFYDGCAY